MTSGEEGLIRVRMAIEKGEGEGDGFGD